MTPDRLRDCLALLRWSQRGLAEALAMDERQVRRWATGVSTVPPAVAAWLNTLAEFAAANPPPDVRQSRAVGPSTRDARAAMRGEEPGPGWDGRPRRVLGKTG